MLWANLIRVNISGLILFLEPDSGVTGSLTSCSQPYSQVTLSSQTGLEETPAQSSKWQARSGEGWGTGPATAARSLLGLSALLLVRDKGWELRLLDSMANPRSVWACPRPAGCEGDTQPRSQKAPVLLASSGSIGAPKRGSPPISQPQHGDLGEGV